MVFKKMPYHKKVQSNPFTDSLDPFSQSCCNTSSICILPAYIGLEILHTQWLGIIIALNFITAMLL